MSIEEKRDVCRVCGIEIGYYKIDKGNGKSTHRAIHIGEVVPDNAVEVSKHSVSSTYRNRMRQAFTHDGKITIVPPTVKKELVITEEDSAESEIVSPIEVEVFNGSRPDDSEEELEASPKLITKEKLDVPKTVITKPIIKYIEVHEFPEGSEDKPEVDISIVKRNKFAAVGAIVKRLSESGMAAQKVNEIRSELIAKGSDFPGIVSMASEHLRFIENGQPLFFRQ